MAKLTFQLSDETKIVVSLLRELNEGDVLPYTGIQSALGYPSVEPCRSAIYSAQRVLMKEQGYVFGTERKIGVKRLKDDEKIAAMHGATKRAQSSCKRGKRISMHLDWSKLTPEQQEEARMLQTVDGVVIELTKEKNLQKMQSLLPATKEMAGLPPAKALDIIKSVILKD